MTRPSPNFVFVAPGSMMVNSMPKGATSSATASTKPSMPHFVVVEAEARMGELAARRGNLNDAPPLRPQMREGGADDMDRASDVGRDLVTDLLVGQFLGGAEKTVAGIVHDDVDPAHAREGVVDRTPHGCGVGHIQKRDMKRVRVALREIVEGPGLRSVAVTRSPRASSFSVKIRPKPEDVPVMNQLCIAE